MTSTFTTDFQHEFEAERSRWLRRRFLWWSGIVSILNIVSIVLTIIGLAVGDSSLVTGTKISVDSTTESTAGAAPTTSTPGGAAAPDTSGAEPQAAPAEPPAAPADAADSDEESADSSTPATNPAPTGASGGASKKPKTQRVDINIPMGTAIVASGAPRIVSLILYVLAFFHIRRRLLGRDAILRIVYWLIVIGGSLTLISSVVQYESVRPTLEAARAQGVKIPAAMNELSVWSGLGKIFVSHCLACMFLPWTAKESVRPLLPLLLLCAVITLFYMSGHWFSALLTIVGSPLIGAPGAAICWWRQGRFKDRFHYTMLRGRYTQMRQELTDARRIHEALFPRCINSGSVRFDFQYQPMRQIGGDFLYAHLDNRSRLPAAPGTPRDPDSDSGPSLRTAYSSSGGGGAGGPDPREPLSIVIIDVTGHGIPAALTVNRLHGELERLFGENRDIPPGDVLTSLNRYVHLTLASHSVYATAICFRADPKTDTLTWASGGHPPAFLRAVDGRVERLDSTAYVLGACHGEDFKHNQQELRFGPGDTLIAYTDGATEARDERGAMLRVEGLQRIIAGIQPRDVAAGGWAAAVLQSVDRHRFGPPADDTLIVELWRPLGA